MKNLVISSLLITLWLFVSIAILISCSDDAGDQNPPDPGAGLIPAITEIGIPTGNAITKMIGPDGGSISSSDGKVEVLIPAGAVSASTEFSVQPITNKCPNGKNAFRLLPSGMTFANPVTLTFHYTDDEMGSRAPLGLAIAFQNTDNIWYSLPSANIDTVARTISVRASHFTDWSNLDRWEMNFVADDDRAEGLNWKVHTGKDILGALGLIPEARSSLSTQSPDDEFVVALTAPLPAEAIVDIVDIKWYVNGVVNGDLATVGTISDVVSKPGRLIEFKYFAPTKVPTPEVVRVESRIQGKKGLKFKTKVMGKEISIDVLTIVRYVRVFGDETKFDVEVRYEHDYTSYVYEDHYSDQARMIVTVKEDHTVVITEITNTKSNVTPASGVGVSGERADWQPDEFGRINIVEATGSTTTVNNQLYLQIDLKQENTQTEKWIITYPDGSVTTIGGQPIISLPRIIFPIVNENTVFKADGDFYMDIIIRPL